MPVQLSYTHETKIKVHNVAMYDNLMINLRCFGIK